MNCSTVWWMRLLAKFSGRIAKEHMVKSKLPNSELSKIWTLADVDKDGYLDYDEFALANYLIDIRLTSSADVPNELPEHLFLLLKERRILILVYYGMVFLYWIGIKNLPSSCYNVSLYVRCSPSSTGCRTCVLGTPTHSSGKPTYSPGSHTYSLGSPAYSPASTSVWRKKKRVDKFYQQQCNLLENFENDSKQIQDFQNKKNQQSSVEVDEPALSSSTNLLSDSEDHPVAASSAAFIDPENGKAGSSVQSIMRKDFTESSKPKLNTKISFLSKDSDGSRVDVARSARHLAMITLLANVSLTLAKAVASYLSGSLSIISSLVDSLVDITSGLVIWLTSRAIKKHDPYLYPVGRTRLEPVALVIVSVIMAVASVQMVVQSMESILNNRIDPHVDIPTICIMICTIIVKMMLYVLCNRLKGDPSISVLAQDHRNDCLSNSIALLCAFSAQKWWIYLDPIGAIVVALYIALTWFRTGKEQLMMLSGRSAEPEFINRIIKVCIDHDDKINFIDTVYVYHFGTRFLVEVHIVLDQEMRLKDAHDISESLQNNIESLPEVERAFVHADYEYEHKPQDEHKLP
uniref:Cation efflux protein cytoplasmic domain-containing protein n=1 Tax=Ditylenchus dipsaci TaxID=166011 RepID=A0A915DI20_9BILA